ncbi:hypothetical protein D3C76_1216110 [compost metagenome]
MDGVSHHGVVDQGDTQALAVLEPQRLCVRELDPIEGPSELFHMAGKVQFDGPAWFSAVRVDEGATQIRIRENPTPVIAKPDPRIVQLWRRGHGLHIDQRIVRFRGRMSLHATAGGHIAVIHTGHVAVVHAGHVAVVHAGHLAVVHASHLAVVHTGHVAVVHASHLAVVHTGHAAVIHTTHAAVVHPHIIHGNERPWIYGRHGCLQALMDSQCTP